MDSYLSAMQGGAATIHDVAFLRFFIPIITVISVPLLCYFGIKGITKRETIMLLGRRGRSFSLGGSGFQQKITGTWALVLGIIYLITTVGLLLILLPVSYYLLF